MNGQDFFVTNVQESVQYHGKKGVIILLFTSSEKIAKLVKCFIRFTS